MAKLKKIVHVEVGRNLSYWISVNPIFIKSALRKGRPSFPYELLNLLRVRDVRLHLVKTKSSYKIWKGLGYYLLRGYKALSGYEDGHNWKQHSWERETANPGYTSMIDIFVIPELPLGTLLGVIAPVMALLIRKRK